MVRRQQQPAEGTSRHQNHRPTSSTLLKKDRPPSSAVAVAVAATTPSRTRVCFKNLPRHVGETELRQFLQQQLRQVLRDGSSEPEILITDCRVVHNNNNKNNGSKSKTSHKFGMAFVGFASPSIAAGCVRDLHRSYWQTSRLAVEWAIPVAEQQKSNLSKKQQQSGSSIKLNKDAAPLVDTAISDAGACTSTRTSTLDGKPNQQLIAMTTTANKSAAATVETKQRDGGGDDPKDDSSTSSSDSDSDEDTADPLLQEKAAPLSRSAMDFLRSKQKAVENLPDDDEDDNKDPGGDQKDHAMIDCKNTNNNNNNTNPMVPKQNDDDKDDASSTPSSSSSSSASSSCSSDDDKDQLSPMKPDSTNTTSSLKLLPPTSSVHIQQEQSDHEETTPTGTISNTNRLFLRNLPFSATEEDIAKHLQTATTTTATPIDILECHVARDALTGTSKGFAFCTLATPAQAMIVLQACDGYDFQGRLLHILPAQPPPITNVNPPPSTSVSYKQQQEQQRQHQAGTATAGWSASVLRGDAVVQHLAERLGMTRQEMWNVKDGLSAGDAAVRLALGETAMIEENRTYFAQHGINMEALVSLQSGDPDNDNNSNPPTRSTTALLVKNLPADTTVEELQALFAVDNTTRILLPPSRTIALVEYRNPNDAKRAFRRLAYRRFKSVPLYLEWAPLLAKTKNHSNDNDDVDGKRQLDMESEEVTNDTGDHEEDAPQLVGPTATLYVKNLSFATTEERLREFFEQGGQKSAVRTVRIPQKVAPIQRGASSQQPQSQSMGYGFVEYFSNDAARAALRKWQSALLDGYALQLQPSSHTSATTVVSKPQTRNSKAAPSKLLVRNVPFQANRQELLQLFGSFGTLKKLRLPKKMDGRHRGFAFVEYCHASEATHAKKALGRTHLYGRHLVLEWAEDDNEQQQQQPLDHLRAKAERDLLANATMPPQGKRIKFS